MSQHASAAGHAAIVAHEGQIRVVLTPNDAAICEGVSKEITAGWTRVDSAEDPESQAHLDQIDAADGSLTVKISGHPVSGISRLYDILGGLGWACVLNIRQDQLALAPSNNALADA